MSEASNPLFPVTYYAPSPGDPHPAHPMVNLPLGHTQPFTLVKDTVYNQYQLIFNYELGANNPTNQNVRILIALFHGTIADTRVTGTVVINNAWQMQQSYVLPAADLNGADSIWIGAWWDDGTYGTGTAANVAAYFAAHPYDPNHHTVPIIIQTS